MLVLARHYPRLLQPLICVLQMYWIHNIMIPLYLCFQVLHFAWANISHLLWRHVFFAELMAAVERGERYERSAHVQTILLRCKAFPIDKIRYNQFITCHDRFAHPNIVLAENVVLGDVTVTEAIFLVMPRSIRHYSATKATFLWMNLFDEVLQLVTMPLDSFHKIADEVGDPALRGDKATIIFNSARCGSTFISQVVDHADPETIVLSEPPILLSMYVLKHYFRPKAFARIVKHSVFLMLKPVKGKRRFVIKPMFLVMRIAVEIDMASAAINSMFIYRKPLSTILAMERAFSAVPFLRLIQLTFLLNRWREGSQIIGFHRTPELEVMAEKYLKPTMFETCCIVWADNWVHYQRNAKLFPFPSLLYDTVYEDAENFYSQLLDFCGISQDRLKHVLDCCNKDSQDGTPFCQEFLQYHTISDVTPSLLARLEKYCTSLGLPQIVPEPRPSPAAVARTQQNVSCPSDEKVTVPFCSKYGEKARSQTFWKPIPVQCIVRE